MDKLLSVIIANRNDTAMLSVTVNSVIEELRPLGLKHCEIIICDNSDLDVYRQLNSCLPIGYVRDRLIKIYRQNFPCLFTARETAIEKSSGMYVCCLDSHMLVGRNMLINLVDFIVSKSKDKTLGFVHAPIRWAHNHERNSVHDRDMSKNELGNWNRKYNKSRIITWKGMPWICRRDWFLDRDRGLNGYGALRDHRVSWGGGDMHIGVKPWLLGFKNWAVPCNAAIHIGPFPKINQTTSNPVDCSGEANGYKYRLYGKSGEYPHTFGFLVSCYVLGGEAMMERNKQAIINRFGRYINVDKYWQEAIELGKEEKAWLNERKVMTFEQLLKRKPWDD
jgi:glycosyltransferase involved in cell wall biosynthesis